MKKSFLVTLLAFSVAGQPTARGELPATRIHFCVTDLANQFYIALYTTVTYLS